METNQDGQMSSQLSGEQSTARQTRQERDAIIFLPGLGTRDTGNSVDELANRFVAAFEKNAKSGKASFMAKDGQDEDYGSQRSYKTRVVTIVRNEEKALPIDIYGLDYKDALIGDAHNRTPIKHILSVFSSLVSNAKKLLFSRKAKSKTAAEKWQVKIAWFSYLVLILYVIILLSAAASAFYELSSQPNNQQKQAITENEQSSSSIEQVESKQDSIKSVSKPTTDSDENQTGTVPGLPR